MKKKCMAVGGTAKKPATMEEQLAGIRGKVRPGYQAGGIAGQVDDLMNRTKAMPNSIASAPQPYGGSVIPAQTGQQAMQAATNFGMPPAGTAPTATSQTISTGDYSTGPRQGGFVDEYGKPRTTQAQDAQAEAAARQAEIAARSKEQLDNIANMKGLSDRQRVAAVSGIAANASRSGVGTDIAGAIGTPMNQLSNRQQLRLSQAQYGVDMQEDGLSQPARRGYRRGYAGGGIVDKLIRAVEKVLPSSNNEKYEPGIQSRAAEDPARHGRAEALNPRTQTASSDTTPAGGFQEEAERRRKQMEEAMNYEASGGMVRFAGKGGPRDDQIPVKVAGEEINVSNGENAVILPAKTAANPAALYAIGGIIQATNDGRKPNMGMEKGGKYKDGAYPYDDKPPPTAQQVYAPTYAAPGSIIGALPEGGYLRTPEGRAQVMEALSGKGLRPDVGILGPRNASTVAPVVAQEQQPTVARNVEVMNSGAGTGRIDLPITHAQKQSAIANTAAARQAQGIAAGVAQPSGAVVNDGMTTTQMGAGFDPTKLQMAPGYGMATNAAGKTIAVGPSEYVGSNGQPTSRWTDTQQYKDAIARNQADKLRLAEMQSQRLGADPMAVQTASQGITGGVLGNKTKQAELQRLEQIQSFVARASVETDPEKQKQYLDSAMALQGKDNKRERNLKTVDLGASTVDDGMGGTKIVPRGQALYDADNNRVVQIGSGGASQTSQQAEGIKAQLAAGKISREKAIEELKKIGFQ